MRESKCYISVACFHYGGSDLLRFGKFEVLITSQALLSQKQPIFMQNYNFVKNDVFVAKICKYALYESSEGLFCAPRKAANFCHPGVFQFKCCFGFLVTDLPMSITDAKNTTKFKAFPVIIIIVFLTFRFLGVLP